jgi:hypothetical protein
MKKIENDENHNILNFLNDYFLYIKIFSMQIIFKFFI